MSRRLAAMVRLRRIAIDARRADLDTHASTAWAHLGFALVMLAIGLGGPIVDAWFPDDPAPIVHGPGELPIEEMTWITTAPSPWLRERVDVDQRPTRAELNVWRKIPPPCQSDDRTCID